jgi:hypothetical protein
MFVKQKTNPHKRYWPVFLAIEYKNNKKTGRFAKIPADDIEKAVGLLIEGLGLKNVKTKKENTIVESETHKWKLSESDEFAEESIRIGM